MITAPENTSFVLGLIYLSVYQALPKRGYADYSFMSDTESKRPRRGVSCPGASDQMDKTGLGRNQSYNTRGITYILLLISARKSFMWRLLLSRNCWALKSTLLWSAFP